VVGLFPFRIKIILFLVALILSIITGCSLTANTGSKLESEYEVFLQNEISSILNQKISDFQIVYTKDTKFGSLSHFTFVNNKGLLCEALVLAKKINDKWIVVNKSFSEVNKKVPFTHFEMSALITDQGRYHMVSGYLNDQNIDNIKITFFDGLLAEIKRSESNTFDYVRLDEPEGGVQKIEAFSSDGKLIYQY
jgi:hypothetical protein